MAYNKTIWKNRVVEKPRTFNMVQNPDGTITLIPQEGVVTEKGTPVEAIKLNNIEDGIYNAHEDIKTINNLIVTTAQPNKILRLNSSGKLPASITGNANTLGGKSASDFYQFVAKRDADGKIIYALETELENLPMTHSYGRVGTNYIREGTFEFPILTVAPSHKKRFLKIEWSQQRDLGSGGGSNKGEITYYETSLLNVTTGEILKTVTNSGTKTYTSDNYIINPGVGVSFRIIDDWKDYNYSYAHHDITLNSFKIYMEDMEVK